VKLRQDWKKSVLLFNTSLPLGKRRQWILLRMTVKIEGSMFWKVRAARTIEGGEGPRRKSFTQKTKIATAIKEWVPPVRSRVAPSPEKRVETRRTSRRGIHLGKIAMRLP